MACTATAYLRPLCQGVRHMRFDLGQSRRIDQRPLLHAGLIACAHLQVLDAGGEFFGKRLVDTVLHQKAVGADAGLPGVAVFRRQSAFHRSVDIGIGENDEGRVAAQLQ